MKRESIFFTITVSFIISIILIIASFVILITQNYEHKEKQLFDRYMPVVKMIMGQHRYGGIDADFVKGLEEINYKIYTRAKEINVITYNPHTKVLLERKNGRSDRVFRILKLKDKNYIYMKRRGKVLLVRDNESAADFTMVYLSLFFIIVLITTTLMYLITYRKLIPLRLLKDKVKTLGDEKFDFECCNTDRKDEVSQLALEFKNTARKLKDIKEARNVFIRNIMHELKTPITKGKFLVEIENSEQNDEKLREVFNRLELLINEFASIEELISSTKNIEKKYYYIDDIIDNAKDILMIDEDRVEGSFENKKIHVNFKLFTIAVKNLIDNALKYSPDKKVELKTVDDDIWFINSGEKLEHDLEEYYEPFFAGGSSEHNSFGLGLYIVFNILKANGYSLEYEYENEKNIFKCVKDKESTK